MNPPTRLQKKKKKKHRSLLLFHILQFPRKQSHPSCWLDGETKLKVDLSPPPHATALNCSRRTNNNSQLRPSRVPSTGAVIYSALSEHKHTHTHIPHDHACDTRAPAGTVGKRKRRERERERASLSSLLIAALFLPHYSPLFPAFCLARAVFPSRCLSPPPSRRFSLTVCFLSLIVSPPPPSLYSPEPLAI